MDQSAGLKILLVDRFQKLSISSRVHVLQTLIPPLVLEAEVQTEDAPRLDKHCQTDAIEIHSKPHLKKRKMSPIPQSAQWLTTKSNQPRFGTVHGNFGKTIDRFRFKSVRFDRMHTKDTFTKLEDFSPTWSEEDRCPQRKCPERSQTMDISMSDHSQPKMQFLYTQK